MRRQFTDGFRQPKGGRWSLEWVNFSSPLPEAPHFRIPWKWLGIGAALAVLGYLLPWDWAAMRFLPMFGIATQLIRRGNFPGDSANADDFYTGAGKINDFATGVLSLQSQIISAGDARFADPVLYPTIEAKVTAARVQAAVELKTIVSIPRVFVPFDSNLVDFTNSNIRNVIEGGNYSVYQPEAYGAEGDNVRNDRDNVQCCISQAASRGTVIFNKLFLCQSKITLPSDSELEGLGWQTGLRFGWFYQSGVGSGGDVYIQNSDTTNGNTNIRLRNFRIEGANTTGGPSGAPVPGPASGLHFRRGSDVIVEGLLIKNVPAISVSHQGISQFRAIDNTITGSGRDGITGGPYGTSPSNHNVIALNTIQAHDDMIACNASVDSIVVGTTPPTDWTIVGNVCRGGSSLSALNFARGILLQGAVDVTVGQNSFLDTNQQGVVVLKDTLTGFRSSSITLVGNHILRVGTVGTDRGQPRYGLEVDGCDDFTATANKISDAAEHGMRLNDVDGFTITGNRILRCGGTDVAATGAGVFLDGESTALRNVKNGTFTKNRIMNSGSAGVYAFWCNQVDFEGNRIYNSGQSGATDSIQGAIVLDGGGVIRVHNNTCTDTQGTKTQTYGLVTRVGTVDYLSAKDNYFQGNRNQPIFLNSTVTTLALRLEQKLQTLAFNASLTPDPFLGEVVEITLTNNVTAVNEPPAYALYSGIRFTLVFIQDGTGGRTVAGFNAAYKVVWSDTGNTANKRSSITFERDKANTAWSMVGAQSPYA